MYCQNCRTPLKIDSSLEDISPAAFDLLAGSSASAVPQQSRTPVSSRLAYPQERKDIYDQASQNAQAPVFKRVIPAPHAEAQVDGIPDGTRSPTKAAAKENPGMSFVMLTNSQLVPPPSSVTKVDVSRTNARNKRLDTSDHGAGGDDERRSLSNQMETTARLFEILSARSDIDHPICVECTELLVEGLQKRLGNATRERDAYVDFLKKINADIPTEEEKRKAEEDLAAAQEAEAEAFAELKRLEQEKGAIDDEIAALEEEARQLDLEEEAFWRDRNAFALTLSEFQNERDGVNLQYDHDSRQLERLQRTNVYNDTFCIGHDGYFGTINGLRLGRLPSQPVEWAEINAAWGQTVLLLATVAEKLGFTFEGYRLRPMGSTSKVEKIEYLQQTSQQQSTSSTNTGNPRYSAADGHGHGPSPTAQSAAPSPKISVLELFSSGDLPLGRMFMHRRFDNAMVAFLECLRQLGEFVGRDPAATRQASQPAQVHSPSSGRANSNASPSGGGGGGPKLPYEIKKDRIGDASIKLGFNQDEGWTKACKYTLTCCKFLLAHASNVAASSVHSPSPSSGPRRASGT
ncbi:MAG: autophagy protein 6 [Sclerophora amabilis]|nr:MAG: autophagy protein 6 [Sclerophora amabilis]